MPQAYGIVIWPTVQKGYLSELDQVYNWQLFINVRIITTIYKLIYIKHIWKEF